MSKYNFQILNDEDLHKVKRALRRDDDSFDDEVVDLILDAEGLVLAYITDEFNAGEYPRPVRRSVMMLCGALDADRVGVVQELKNGNYLPERVQSMLFTYRKPTAV